MKCLFSSMWTLLTFVTLGWFVICILIKRLYFSQGSFMCIEKLIRKHRVPHVSPLLIVPPLLTSCFNVAHLLELINQYWYFYSLQFIVYIRGLLFLSYLLWILTNAVTCNHLFTVLYQIVPVPQNLLCFTHSSLHIKI